MFRSVSPGSIRTRRKHAPPVFGCGGFRRFGWGGFRVLGCAATRTFGCAATRTFGCAVSRWFGNDAFRRLVCGAFHMSPKPPRPTSQALQDLCAVLLDPMPDAFDFLGKSG